MGEYDLSGEARESFFVPTTDGKGHSLRVEFRIMGEYVRNVEKVVHSKWFPYVTASDFYRHAVSRHIKYLQTQAPLQSMSAQTDIIAKILEEAEQAQKFTKIFDKLKKVIGEHVANGRPGQATSLIIQLRPKFDALPDGEWRDQYVKEFEREFGYLMAGGESVSKLFGDE